MIRQRRNPQRMTPGPFARVAAAAIFDKRMPAAALRVLAAVATYADAAGVCFPAVSTVANRLGLSCRQVFRHMAKLDAAGYLERQRTKRSRGGFGANLYRLHFPAAPVPERASDATPHVASSAPADATPHVATHATPRVASSDATPHVTLTRPLNKTIGTRVRLDAHDGSEWNTLCERLKARHGFNHATACEVAASACMQVGGAARLDTIMAAAEASGTSAHDKIMAAVAGAEAA